MAKTIITSTANSPATTILFTISSVLETWTQWNQWTEDVTCTRLTSACDIVFVSIVCIINFTLLTKTCSDRLQFRLTQHVPIPKWRNRFIAGDPQNDINDHYQQYPETGTPDLRHHVVNVVKQPFFLWWGPAGFTLASKAQKALVPLLLLIVQVSLLSLRGENVKRQSEFTCTWVFYGLTASQEKPARPQRGMCWKTTLAELKWTLIIQSVSGLVLRMHLICVLQFYCPFSLSLALPLLVILHSIKVNVRQEEVWGENWLQQTRTHINSRNKDAAFEMSHKLAVPSLFDLRALKLKLL